MKWSLFSVAAELIVLTLIVFSNAQKAPNLEIELVNIHLAVFERDLNHPTESDKKSLNYGDKLLTKFSMDVQKKLRMSFAVNNKKSKTPVVVHQSFLVLTHAKQGREIIFIAEPNDNTKTYTIDLDMKVHGKDFGGMNGLYTARLVLGDATISKPIDWHFCDLSLSVPQISAASMPKSSQINYDILPEIRHIFRSPEPRPSVLVSDTFAIICAAPLLLMFILWLRIGLNFGNIKCSLYALGFHLGLGAIFGLYLCYWLELNMFQTLKWLTFVGVPTLFFGNRLLHGFSAVKKSKSE